MPSMQLGFIGRRRWMAIAALMATLAAFVAAGPLDPMVWIGHIGGTTLAFVINNRRIQGTTHGLSPVDVFDSWLGAAGATLLGTFLALWSNSGWLGVAAVAGLCCVWSNTWAFPRLTIRESEDLVERNVQDIWRSERVLVETVRRQVFHPLWPVVSFSVQSDPTHSDVRQRDRIARYFSRPFLLTVLFAPDSHQATEGRPFESPVVNLDTSTPLWTGPSSAHARLAFESKIQRTS